MADYGLPQYGLEFDPKADLEKFRFWIFNNSITGDGWTPMFAWVWNADFCGHGTQKGTNFLHVPNSKGLDWRLKDGGSYMRNLAVMDPEEREKRRKVYREKIRPFIEDIDKVWEEGGYKNKLFAAYERIQAVDMKKLDDVELMKFFEDEIQPMNRMMGEFHFIFGYPFFDIPTLFWEECQKYGIGMYDPMAIALFQGLGNKFIQLDMEQWRLSRRAIELKIDGVFRSNKPEDVVPKLKENKVGREWLKELDEFLKVWGYMMIRQDELITPTWIEDSTPVIINVTRHLQLSEDENPELREKAQAKRREEAEKEFLAKIPAGDREYITVLMRAAQKCSRWSDEHAIDFDQHAWSLIRLWCMEVGRRLVEKDFLDSPDDTLFFIPEEILRRFYAPEYHDWRSLARKRRQVWEENRERAHTQPEPWPPFIALPEVSPEEIVRITLMNEFIRTRGIGIEPPLYPEVEADMHGKPGAPGIGEGPARIVLTDEDLAEVKKGEVLVCTMLTPLWAMAYPMVKGVLTEAGGILSHAAILGREYGTPVAVALPKCTSIIKNGQRIRVDGTRGLVFFLDK
jgi:pyruvate,water dikinase